jgi:N-acetylneuraminic acid mutarotase
VASHPDPNTRALNAASVSINGKAYVTNQNVNVPNQNTLWEYNPLTYTWTQKASSPVDLGWGLSAFVINDIAYFGSIGPNAYFFSYDPSTDTWAQKTGIASTFQKVSSYAFAIGGRGYLGGGCDFFNQCYVNFYEYDPVTDTWAQKSNFGLARGKAVTGVVAGKGYVIGGQDNNSTLTKECWEYDPAVDLWMPKSDLPGDRRRDHAGFTIGNRIFVGTGFNGTNVRLSDFYEYQPITDAWTQRANYGFGCHKATGFSANNKGYFSLGESTGGASTYSTLVYQPNIVTGLEESVHEPVLVISGNGSVQVNFLSETTAKIQLTTLLGQLIIEKEIAGEKVVFQVPDMAKTMYLLKIISGEKVYTRRLVL